MLIGCSGNPEEVSEKPTSDEGRSSAHDASGSTDATVTASNESVADAGDAVELDAITLTPPAGWQRQPPASSFVAAEFTLSPAAGDSADGRLTVSAAGGSIEANIDRWKAQFDPDPTEASHEVVDVAGIKVTMVDLAGDFNDQRGPFAPATRQPSYRMFAAIIPVDEQLYFVKATGPQKTIAAHEGEIRQFILSVQRRRR
jgi:hypothetical protein